MDTLDSARGAGRTAKVVASPAPHVWSAMALSHGNSVFVTRKSGVVTKKSDIVTRKSIFIARKFSVVAKKYFFAANGWFVASRDWLRAVFLWHLCAFKTTVS